MLKAQQISLDPYFGQGGIASFDPTPGLDRIIAAFPLSNGKIVVGYLIGDETDTAYYGAARFNQDGSIDNDFGTNGLANAFEYTGYSYAMDMALQPDGKIVVGGANGFEYSVVRLMPDGTPDPSFGNAGKVTYEFGGSAMFTFTLKIRKSGAILLNTETDIGIKRAMIQLKPNGSIDSSFADNGTLIPKPDNMYGYNWPNMMELADEKIVFVGRQPSWPYKTTARRYFPDGSLDTTFVSLDSSSVTVIGENRILDVQSTKSGHILAAGYTNNPQGFDYGTIVKYKPNGEVDSSFGGGKGHVLLAIGNYYTIIAFAGETPEGKILAGGSSVDSTGSYILLVQLDSLGNPDTLFGDHGIVRTQRNGLSSYGRARILYENGKILVAGSTRSADFTTSSFTLAQFYPSDQLSISTEKKLHDIGVYPNPSAQAFTLKYHLSEATTLTVILKDILGRELKTLSPSSLQSAGDHLEIFQWPVELTPQLYLLEIRTNEGSETIKIMQF